MIKGKILNTNSTIGIISPASCSEDIIINTYINKFKSLGFKIVKGNHIHDKHGYFSGTDIDRAKELTNMFLDDSIDGIICFRGGYGSIRILPHIDMSIIKNNPKFFCGYSDITILLNYFANNGLITFHGPMIKSNFDDVSTLSYLKRMLFNPTKGFIYDFSNCIKFNNNYFSGKLMGGNLSMICSSIGTPYDINLDNSILLLEEVNEPPYVIDRLLTQLLLSSKLNKCNAIIIGHMTNCTDDNNYSFDTLNIIKNILLPLNIPIILNVPFGHSYPNLTFPIGCYANYNKKTNQLVLCENSLL